MMEQLSRVFDGHDPLLWAAAAAAALGASLLAAALALRLRRRPASRRPRRSVAWLQPRPDYPLPGRGAARAVPGGYAPAQPALTPAPGAAAAPAAADLDVLLARLRRASDRLAALQDDARESRLKAGPAPSDQLYRKGVG